MEWIATKERTPVFHEMVHDEFGDDITVTDPVFVYHQHMGVLPAIGFKNGFILSWWEYLGSPAKTAMSDNLVTHWAGMDMPPEP